MRLPGFFILNQDLSFALSTSSYISYRAGSQSKPQFFQRLKLPSRLRSRDSRSEIRYKYLPHFRRSSGVDKGSRQTIQSTDIGHPSGFQGFLEFVHLPGVLNHYLSRWTNFSRTRLVDKHKQSSGTGSVSGFLQPHKVCPPVQVLVQN